MKTIERCKCNNIKGLKLDDGHWVSEHSDIVKEIERFYSNLFTTSRPTNLDHVLNLIPTLVDNFVNDRLTRGVTDEEIKKAVFDMHPLKLLSSFKSIGILFLLMYVKLLKAFLM